MLMTKCKVAVTVTMATLLCACMAAKMPLMSGPDAPQAAQVQSNLEPKQGTKLPEAQEPLKHNKLRMPMADEEVPENASANQDPQEAEKLKETLDRIRKAYVDNTPPETKEPEKQARDSVAKTRPPEMKEPEKQDRNSVAKNWAERLFEEFEWDLLGAVRPESGA